MERLVVIKTSFCIAITMSCGISITSHKRIVNSTDASPREIVGADKIKYI
ncbi:hypothetical protein KSF_032560 [Reticulibacter mediterranei]|uniref:Uncharacterized protein n=1 Tax=Reticulibacter mediterranei TaxID=2778369 RepID=A0A8J3IIS7_9CHLR|nr:hypothetical protein KSF_032560 [Reticulibacter mediterranei]